MSVVWCDTRRIGMALPPTKIAASLVGGIAQADALGIKQETSYSRTGRECAAGPVALHSKPEISAGHQQVTTPGQIREVARIGQPQGTRLDSRRAY